MADQATQSHDGPLFIGVVKSIFAGTSSFFSGVWLVILYITFVSLVVFSLGAHQLQYSIRSFRVEEGRYLPLWAVSQIYTNWIRIEERIDQLRFDLVDKKQELDDLTSEEESGEGAPSNLHSIEFLKNQIKIIEDDLAKNTKIQESLLVFDEYELDESVGDFILSMRFYKETLGYSTVFGRILPDFMSLPPEVLTIILVLSMGALGGTIHLTRNYFDAENRRRKLRMVQTIGYYIFRPFLGAITALSIYILAKAGILVFANPSNAGFGGALSPFFVSFLGIISGLLAEQAVETIQRAGRQWFAASPNVGRERWAIRVSENLKDGEEAQLANALGISQDKLAGWLAQKYPVPERQQRIIAAWLRKPASELFTDIDPNSTTEETPEAPPAAA